MTSITKTARADPAWTAATTMHRLDQARRLAETAARLRTADQRLLWLFTDHRPRSLRAIADELRLEQSTVNRQVNAAVKAGLVRRFREPDHKTWQFAATDAGLDTFERDLRHHFGLLNAALAAVPESDRERFVAQFDAFAAAYADAAQQVRPAR